MLRFACAGDSLLAVHPVDHPISKVSVHSPDFWQTAEPVAPHAKTARHPFPTRVEPTRDLLTARSPGREEGWINQFAGHGLA